MALFLFSCRLNTDEYIFVDKLEQGVPNIIFFNIHLENRTDEKLTEEIEAEKFQVYSSEDIVEAFKSRFTLFGQKGEPRLKGEAGYTRYNRSSEDMEIRDGAKLYFHGDETSITAEDLFWKNKNKLLGSKEGNVIEMTKSDGSVFKGRGFSADFRSKTIQYTGGAEGVIARE